MIRVVARAAFPMPLRGAWSGGMVDFCRAPQRCWAGRAGTQLIRWMDSRLCQCCLRAEADRGEVLCARCAHDQIEVDMDEDGAEDLALHLHDGCRHCGRVLDPFGQCWACDTYGTPAEQALERAQ